MADIFDVVADTTRRDILTILRERYAGAGDTSGEISVSEIVAQLGLSQPTVSKHLKVLREAGLVSVREDGQHRLYNLEYGPLEAIEDWLIPFLSLDFSEADFEAADADYAASKVKLADEAKEFATSFGKAIADTSHKVTAVVDNVASKTWRKGE